MKKLCYITIIIFISVIIILNFNKSKKDILEDIMIFNLWNQNEYTINTKNSKKVQINIFDTVNNKNNKQKKIAPGSEGKFIIKIIRPENSNIQITILDNNTKPQNLKFYLDGKSYNFIKEMEKEINDKFQNTQEIEIYWKWEYSISEEDDMQDTEDGEGSLKYIFEIEAKIDM